MGKKTLEQRLKQDPDPVRTAVAARLSNLYHSLGSNDRYLFGSVNVTRRNHGDWLAICKVVELDTMRKLIAFGAGKDYFDALRGLNATIASGKWKDDKPWPVLRVVPGAPVGGGTT